MTYRCGNCGCYDVFAGQDYCSEPCERQREAEIKAHRAAWEKQQSKPKLRLVKKEK